MTSKPKKKMSGSERHCRPGAKWAGDADLYEQLSVTIRLREHLRAPPLPTQDDWAKLKPSDRIFLTPEKLGQDNGADPVELATVAACAKNDGGLNIDTEDIARRIVVVSGTVDKMNKFFGVKLGNYVAIRGSNVEPYRGREGHIFLPEEIFEFVVGVFGLDNRGMAEREITSASLTVKALALTPQEVAKLYRFPASGAAGQTIGLLEFRRTTIGYTQKDLDLFSLPAPKPTDVCLNGVTNSPFGPVPNDDVEVVLDIDVAGAVAPGAAIAVYFTTWDEKGWVDALTRVVHPATGDPRPSVLSISWGHAEYYGNGTLNWSQAAMDNISNLLQQAASLGVTVFAATGDRGTDCHVGDGKAHVMYPASDPWVTACGGTTISAVNQATNTCTQNTWNDSTAKQTGVTGGGYSANSKNPLPSWQSMVVPPPPPPWKGRGIPDVAGNASPNSGYTIYVNAKQVPTVGGTSAVAPLYAGLVAIINASKGKRVGWLNPTLYQAGITVPIPNPPVFVDINDGRNNRDNSAKKAPFYTSGKGWDACNGWGSIYGDGLSALL